ncbi:unnamed protein product [Closterium sp. Naga37s-1]|nr:unnamed protein product [Closterium sp. Naga37s-1]
MEGGLGLADLKIWLDGLAVRRVGKLLAEPDGVRRWLAEEAAELPQGTVTWYAHPVVIKKWTGGSERWKAAAKAFWKTPFADLPDPLCRWEVDEEWVCFNRKLMRRGKSPFGLQKGSEWIMNLRVRDLLTEVPGDRRRPKSVEELTAEIGDEVAAALAAKAYEALPAAWKEMALAPVTAQALKEATSVVSVLTRQPGEKAYWKVTGTEGAKIVASHLHLKESGKLEALAGSAKACFEVCGVQSVAEHDMVLVGPPRA